MATTVAKSVGINLNYRKEQPLAAASAIPGPESCT